MHGQTMGINGQTLACASLLQDIMRHDIMRHNGGVTDFRVARHDTWAPLAKFCRCHTKLNIDYIFSTPKGVNAAMKA
eukprot:scaffold485924_cov19-Prasinocladus_malaysianus.AAC.1